MELIRLKGAGDGVKIYMSADEPFQQLLGALQDKLRAWRKFFGTGHCNMYFIGRELSRSDTIRLEAVVHALLPESTILYGERRIGDTIKLPDEFVQEMNRIDRRIESERQAENTTAEADAEAAPEPEESGSGIDAESTQQFERIRDVVTSNFKSSRARFYEGAVRAGRVVESDGHLILIGNVERGGTLIATGNVIVIGSLAGSVQAGCMGNRNAYIIALDMHPTDLRIAHVTAKYDEDTDEISELSGIKQAHLINNDIFVEDFLLKL